MQGREVLGAHDKGWGTKSGKAGENNRFVARSPRNRVDPAIKVRWDRRCLVTVRHTEGVVMGSLIVRVLGAVASAIFLATMFGYGYASADALNGQTYDDAVATISSKWNGKAVIGTVNGDQLPMGECIVTGWHKSKFLDASGKNRRQDEIVLHLNCNNRLASPGRPGNSSMSPEGLGAKKDERAAANINKNPDFCKQSDAVTKWCQGVCHRTGLCDV
jgi:hypothetical protein